MSLRLVKLLVGSVGVLVQFLFVGGILEVLGMMFYLQWASEAALRNLMADGVTPGEVVGFLLASPDRLLVAIALAVVAALLVWSDSSGSTRHHHGHGHDDDDADGGFGFGDGGDGGGGFGGDGGGGGGGE